ncbi:hypothetical protein NDU88_002149 [Pleurodeles waltl]|uniref:Uncharacterized protein n=1 Tax=Pleurodeles waltl TaxID=8319 RepID=A0AAV7TMF6_PLEWA|nr:hypothetical protein NDU88_002149 [Pleurodeles waltl]
MWVLRGTVAAGRLHAAQAVPAASSVPATSFCGLVLKRSAAALLSQVASHLRTRPVPRPRSGTRPTQSQGRLFFPASSSVLLGRHVPGEPTSGAPLGPQSNSAATGAGDPLPARKGPRASQAPIRVAGEQRAPPFTPN